MEVGRDRGWREGEGGERGRKKENEGREGKGERELVSWCFEPFRAISGLRKRELVSWCFEPFRAISGLRERELVGALSPSGPYQG